MRARLRIRSPRLFRGRALVVVATAGLSICLLLLGLAAGHGSERDHTVLAAVRVAGVTGERRAEGLEDGRSNDSGRRDSLGAKSSSAHEIISQVLGLAGGPLYVRQRLRGPESIWGATSGTVEHWWASHGRQYSRWQIFVPCACGPELERAASAAHECSMTGESVRALDTENVPAPDWLVELAALETPQRERALRALVAWRSQMETALDDLDLPRRTVAGHVCVEFQFDFDRVCLAPETGFPLAHWGPNFELVAVAIRRGPQPIPEAVRSQLDRAVGVSLGDRNAEAERPLAREIAAAIERWGRPARAWEGAGADPWLANFVED